MRYVTALIGAVVLAYAALAAPTGDPNAQRLLGDTELGPHWIYNDVDKAFAAARSQSKPLLVLFRCVPCNCASALDKSIRTKEEMEAIEQKFICVRVTQMNGIDRRRFQFDLDLSLAVLFMNADGTVYGRFGTRAVTSRTEMTHISEASFITAMRRSLDLHAGYPGNRAALSAKQGDVIDVPLPEKMAHIKPFPMVTAVKDCIHCHMVGEAHLADLREKGRLALRDIYPYPLPEQIGIRIDLADGLKVKSVRAGSIAAAAGVVPGDSLETLDGQPLVSIGDMQWALHHATDGAKIALGVLRGAKPLEMTMELSGPWRKFDWAWRETMSGARPGFTAASMSGGDRKRRGLPAEGMALSVIYLLPAGGSGGPVRPGDVILAVDGRPDFLTESELLAYLYIRERPAQSMKLSIDRKGQRIEVVVPVEGAGR